MSKIVKNDIVDYANRYIYQFEDAFKFSLDSVLLAEYVNLKKNAKIIDLCTGNGVIPLVLSLKTNSKIIGVEIQSDLAFLATKSVNLNNLSNQITIINDDIKNITGVYNEYFDVITCNPPYFKCSESSFKNKNDFKCIARHEVLITLEEIMQISFKILKNDGILYMVHRSDRLDDIMYLARKYKMNVKEVQLITTKNGDNPKIVLVKCVKNGNDGVKIKKEICVENMGSYQHLFR